MIEMLVVIGILLTLIALTTLSLLSVQNKTNLNTLVNGFITDLKEQQTRAMVGDAGVGSSPDNYGIHFSGNMYTLFQGTYSAGASSNFIPALPSAVQVATSFPGGDLIFTKGSGEANAAGTVTFTNTANNTQKTVTVNRYGVVTGVN